jgi:hypothetical protein
MAGDSSVWVATNTLCEAAKSPAEEDYKTDLRTSGGLILICCEKQLIDWF